MKHTMHTFKIPTLIISTIFCSILLISSLYAITADQFCIALDWGKYEVVKKYLDNNTIDLNKPFKPNICEGRLPLQCTDDIKKMQLLIDRGAKVNLKHKGYSILEAAAGNKDGGASGLFLLKKGAKATGYALYQALWYENTKLAEALIDAGADVNWHDKQGLGYSPLVIASQNGYSLQIIKKLVNAGANVNFATTDEKLTALHFFPSKRSIGHQGHSGNMDDLKVSTKTQLEKVKFLLSKGARLGKKSKYGYTPFLTATAQNEKVAFYLISKGSNIWFKSHDRETALHLAAGSGFKKLTAYLLKKGHSVHRRTKKGRTPIFGAAQNGNLAIIKMLIQKGAKCYVFDYTKTSPLHLIAIFPTAKSHYTYLSKHEQDYYKALEIILKRSGRYMIHRRNIHGETPWFNLRGWMYPLPQKIKLFLKYGAKKWVRHRTKRKTLLQMLIKENNTNKYMTDSVRKFYIESIRALR